MHKSIKKSVVISILVIIIVVAVIATFYIVKNNEKQVTISTVSEIFTNRNIQNITIAEEYTEENEVIEKIQETTETQEITKDDLVIKIDGENVIGVLTIEKINFNGLIYEGTSLETLDKGIGHFTSSPYFEGNVCLAGHNYKGIWNNLHRLRNGDIISYVSFLGERKYSVYNIVEIEETDLSVLQNFDKNIITLITCVNKKPSKRLAVQAIEVD